MTKTNAAKIAAANIAARVKARRIRILERAYLAVGMTGKVAQREAARTYRILHAGVFAAFPGTQDDANVAGPFHRAILAGSRTIRRG